PYQFWLAGRAEPFRTSGGTAAIDKPPSAINLPKAPPTCWARRCHRRSVRFAPDTLSRPRMCLGQSFHLRKPCSQYRLDVAVDFSLNPRGYPVADTDLDTAQSRSTQKSKCSRALLRFSVIPVQY